jgi:hypothetical protein
LRIILEVPVVFKSVKRGCIMAGKIMEYLHLESIDFRALEIFLVSVCTIYVGCIFSKVKTHERREG